MSEYVGTRPFELKELTIVSSKQKAYDIKELLVELTVYEDLFSMSVTGVLILSDAMNLISNLPIVGGEKIRTRFKTEGYNDYIDIEFTVAKINDRKNIDLRTQMYSLILVRDDMLKSSGMLLSKAYEGETGQIIQTVLKDMGSKQPVVQDVEAASQAFIAPTWPPFDVIKELTSCAVTADSSPCVFYDTVDGYNFTTISKLVDADRESEKNLTYSAIQARQADGETQDSFDNVIEYAFVDSNDQLHLLDQGAFQNKLISVDMSGKTTEKFDFKYNDRFSGIPTIDKYPVYDLGLYDTEKPYYTLDTGVTAATIQKRKAVLNFLGHLGVRAMIPGDSHIRVGQLINFKVPSPEIHTDRFLAENLTSGRWLLTSCKHVIKKDSYVNGIELFKDSYGLSFDSITGEING